MNKDRSLPKLNRHVCFKHAALVRVWCLGIAGEGVGRARTEKHFYWEEMDIFDRDTCIYSFVAQLSPIKGMKELSGHFLKITKS